LGKSIAVLLSAAVVGALTLLGHYCVSLMQRRNERAKYYREKLLDRYAELITIASAEVERVKSIEACMAIGSPNGKHEEGFELDQKRHPARVDLLRVSMQITLFETDAILIEKVEKIAKSQPFMVFAFPPRFGEGNYDDRFDKYQADIRAYESQLVDLVATVRNIHPAR
jgi:hypothetical protein